MLNRSLSGRESREITLRNARKKIEALAHQLSLRRDRIEMAFHFFKVCFMTLLQYGGTWYYSFSKFKGMVKERVCLWVSFKLFGKYFILACIGKASNKRPKVNSRHSCLCLHNMSN